MRALKALAVAAAMLLVSGEVAAQVKDYRDIKTPPMRSFNPVQPKRIVLPNGMVVFLQEDKELPLITGRMLIRGGSRDLPAAKSGLVEILGQSWRTGGTKTKTGDQLDEMLESRAASVETGADDDSSTVSFNLLKQDFDFVFPIFLDILRNPEFRQEKIDLAKTQLNSGISRRNDEPGGIASRESTTLGYGKNSSFIRQPEYETVASVTRDDLLAFHKRFVHPNNMIFGISGDFDAAAMEKKLRAAFEKWEKGPQAPPAPTDIAAAKPGVYFIPKEDVTQANIVFVHGGTTRNSPDYAALQVMNEILGGGFSGRLMNQLRSKMGLTYGIGGGVGTQWDYPGLFRISTSTKSETTMQSIVAIRNEIASLRSAPPTAEEMRLAKDSILNAFVFTMDSKAKVLNQRMVLEFYGYPADFFSKYPGLVEKVSAEDVSRVANKYVQPDQVSILVVGNDKAFDKPLSDLGPVTTIDITIPEPGAKKDAAPKATSTSGDAAALAAKVREFVGGKAKIDAVQAIRTTAAMSMKTPQGEMQADYDAITRYPDGQRVAMKLPMGEITTVATPSAAFVITPMGMQDLPASQKEASLADLKTDTIAVLKHLDDPKYVFAIDGKEKVGDVEATVLAVNADGHSFKWLVDPATGRVLRKVSQARGPMPGELVNEFVEWKEFGGLKLPSNAKLIRGGEQAGSFVVSNIEINPSFDAKLFEKPAK